MFQIASHLNYCPPFKLHFFVSLSLTLLICCSVTVLGISSDVTSHQSTSPIFYGNEALFRSLQTTRYSTSQTSLNVIDVVELFLLGSSTSEIETFLTHGSGQHRFAVDVTAVNGGLFASSSSSEALMKVSPSSVSQSSLIGDSGDLILLTRIKLHPPCTQSNNLLTVSTLDHSLSNSSMIIYRPILSITVGDDRVLIESGSSKELTRIPIPVRLIDDKWHSLVIHWTTNGVDGNDDFYVWVDCQLVYQGIAFQPAIFNSNDWTVSVGSPPLPTFMSIEEPPYFLVRKQFRGLIEQLVITRDRLFWQSDDQCRYQRETSAIKDSCPICTSSTFFANNAIKSAQSKLLNAIGKNKQKLVEEFDTIKEQLGAALRRIEFLERLQKLDEQKADGNGRCFEREGGRYFRVNETWSVNNCTRHCACQLVNNRPRSVCMPLRCSPNEVANCPPFPFGGVVWDLANGCCPRCQRKHDTSQEATRLSGRSCIRWHRASSVPHGAYFFIKLENDTCAEKRCIDGRETIVRQGPRSVFCGTCLKNVTSSSKNVTSPSQLASSAERKDSTRVTSRKVCCGVDTMPCKMRSCQLNASSVCDVPERATCQDTEEDIICQCRPGFIGDGFRCIDIDECQEHPGTRFSANCSDNEVCINTPGSYYCVAKTMPQPDPRNKLVTMSSTLVQTKYYYPIGNADKNADGSSTLKCDDATEILVRFSPSSVMCHCLPGFVRLRPTVLLAFNREKLPKTLAFFAQTTNLSATEPIVHKQCFDIDECKQLTHACSEKHQCANVPGSYVCISTSYTAHEAPEIKFTANARRSTENLAAQLPLPKISSFLTSLLLFVLFY